MQRFLSIKIQTFSFFSKVLFKHVFGIELKQFKSQVKLNGFHFDPLGVLEKSGAIELVDTQYGPQGFYKAFVKIGEQTLRPEKTFFPKSWDHYKVMECVIEALGNVKDIEEKGNDLFVRGLTKGGVKIAAWVSKSGIVFSWYPIL